MINKFFGVHPQVVRSGLWARMRPGEKDLLIYLCEQSERHCTRELKRTDAQINAAVGTAPRTLCNARKHLAEYGLIQYCRTDGNKFVYVICDPETGTPYPGDARQPLTCHKRRTAPTSEQSARAVATGNRQPEASNARQKPPLEAYGLPGVFSE
jgi:hypothetical protein